MVVGTADRNLVVFDLQNPQFSVWCLHQLQLDQAFQKVYKIFSSVQSKCWLLAYCSGILSIIHCSIHSTT
ncbi:hypothetical protein AAC387_Pa04g0875 [Persea americana]